MLQTSTKVALLLRLHDQTELKGLLSFRSTLIQLSFCLELLCIVIERYTSTRSLELPSSWAKKKVHSSLGVYELSILPSTRLGYRSGASPLSQGTIFSSLLCLKIELLTQANHMSTHSANLISRLSLSA